MEIADPSIDHKTLLVIAHFVSGQRVNTVSPDRYVPRMETILPYPDVNRHPILIFDSTTHPRIRLKTILTRFYRKEPLTKTWLPFHCP